MNLWPLAAAVAAAAFAAALGTALLLKKKLDTARAELEAERARKSAPATRVVEDRRERFSLIWFPSLTVKDDERLVVSAAAGVPHCARCVQPLRLAQGEEWACPRCGDRRPASIVDLSVTDSVAGEAVVEYLARHDSWRADSGVPDKRER